MCFGLCCSCVVDLLLFKTWVSWARDSICLFFVLGCLSLLGFVLIDLVVA